MSELGPIFDPASPVGDRVIGQPAWRIALLYPPQGSWTEQEYLGLDAGRLVEFDHGCVEVLDMPTKEHQRLVRYLFLVFQQFVESGNLGEVFFAPIPVRLWQQKYREPDIVFVKPGRAEINGYPDGADLVVEVVSQSASDRKRDLETKLAEYQQAMIPEYWIVDPVDSTVTVNSLKDGSYIAKIFKHDEIASSSVLAGFEVSVADVFSAKVNPT